MSLLVADFAMRMQRYFTSIASGNGTKVHGLEKGFTCSRENGSSFPGICVAIRRFGGVVLGGKC